MRRLIYERSLKYATIHLRSQPPISVTGHLRILSYRHPLHNRYHENANQSWRAMGRSKNVIHPSIYYYVLCILSTWNSSFLYIYIPTGAASKDRVFFLAVIAHQIWHKFAFSWLLQENLHKIAFLENNCSLRVALHLQKLVNQRGSKFKNIRILTEKLRCVQLTGYQAILLNHVQEFYHFMCHIILYNTTIMWRKNKSTCL